MVVLYMIRQELLLVDEVFLPGNTFFDTTICLSNDFVLNIDEKLGFTYVWSYVKM